MSQKEKDLRFDLVEHGFMQCATCPFARGLSRTKGYRARCGKGKRPALIDLVKARACELHEALTQKSFKSRRLPKK